MLNRAFRFSVPGAERPHQVDVLLERIDARETVWVDGILVHDRTALVFANEIPVTCGTKKGVVSLTAGWHSFGCATLTVDGQLIAPAPDSAALPELPRPAMSKAWMVRWFLLCTVGAAMIGSAIARLLMN